MIPSNRQTKNLIEVALPIDAINKTCAQEKSIRHGQPFQRELDSSVTGVNYDFGELLGRAGKPS